MRRKFRHGQGSMLQRRNVKAHTHTLETWTEGSLRAWTNWGKDGNTTADRVIRGHRKTLFRWRASACSSSSSLQSLSHYLLMIPIPSLILPTCSSSRWGIVWSSELVICLVKVYAEGGVEVVFPKQFRRLSGWWEEGVGGVSCWCISSAL